MINVSPGEAQADAHLIEFPDGTVVMVDVADAVDAPGRVIDYLKSHRVQKVDLVVISHFHKDHYGRLRDLIDSGVVVGRVAGNVPERVIADREIPWGADWDDIQDTLRFLNERGVPYFTPVPGQRLVEIDQAGTPITLDVVVLYNGVDTPVGETDVNDTSILVMLTHGATRALFTGDLNVNLGSWLAESDLDLAADILKVPHHGTEGVAPNEFFARVNPTVALVPAFRDLWLSERSQRIREYFESHRIPTFVNGIDGNVEVVMTADGFAVKSEFDGREVRVRIDGGVRSDIVARATAPINN